MPVAPGPAVPNIPLALAPKFSKNPPTPPEVTPPAPKPNCGLPAYHKLRKGTS